ncbi:MAG: tetratricopeptide repeat protein [Polyangia bacterium]
MRRPDLTKTLQLLFGLMAGAMVGCASGNVPADVRVPPELLRGSPYTAGGEPARTRYVIRMTDGQRDWEIQLPEIATAYEVRVPLTGAPTSPLAVDMATMTSADREILEQNEASRRAPDDDDKNADNDDDKKRGDKNGDKKGDKKSAVKPRAGQTPPAARPSYLLTLERVKELYRTRHYELGLVELVELEKQYPEDEHVLSMKGSLYERLGNKALARDAWQQVLRINPYNLAVLEALQRLGK